MLQALRPNPRRQSVAAVQSIPAPVGGLNARDALASMKPYDALVMDNFFPEANYVALRRGHSSFATGCGGAVQTLMTYNALNGSEKLFAGANNKIWNVTTAGVATSAYSTSITSNKWNWVNFTNTGGTYIIAVNGANTPLKYDGTTWATDALTGSISSSANITNVFQFKERLFFCEKNTLDLWYLSSQAITGTLTKLPLGGVFERGGQIIAGGSFSYDSAGLGIANYLVAVTDNGEAAVYTGITPASDFVLRGVYNVGTPLGNRCIVKVGGDLIIITTKGAVPLSQMIVDDRAKADQLAITSKIQEAFNGAAQNYSSNFGWQGLVYPKSRWVLFNIPEVEGVRQLQYVQNIITGSWCRFTGMNAGCWGLLNDELYFGGNDGTVYKADTGKQDNGGQITWDLKSAFNACGSAGQNKFFKAIRPLLLVSGTAAFNAGINVDFDDVPVTGTVMASAGDTCLWGSGLWGTNKWGGLGLLVRRWLSCGRIGTYVAARLKGAASGISVQCNGFDIMYEKAQGTIY